MNNVVGWSQSKWIRLTTDEFIQVLHWFLLTTILSKEKRMINDQLLTSYVLQSHYFLNPTEFRWVLFLGRVLWHIYWPFRVEQRENGQMLHCLLYWQTEAMLICTNGEIDGVRAIKHIVLKMSFWHLHNKLWYSYNIITL